MTLASQFDWSFAYRYETVYIGMLKSNLICQSPRSNGLIVSCSVFISTVSLPKASKRVAKIRPLAIRPRTRAFGWFRALPRACSRPTHKNRRNSTGARGVCQLFLFFYIWSYFVFGWVMTEKENDLEYLVFLNISNSDLLYRQTS